MTLLKAKLILLSMLLLLTIGMMAIVYSLGVNRDSFSVFTEKHSEDIIGDSEDVIGDSIESIQSSSTGKDVKRDKLNILLFKDDYEEAVSKFKKNGGPHGELTLFQSVKAGLSNLNHDFTFVGSRGELCKLNLSLFDFFILDQYGLKSMKVCHKQDPDCKYRLLDFWGTPISQNHLKLSQLQYLVPYPNGYNEFMGFVISQRASGSEKTGKKRQGILWGKEFRYFQYHLDLIRKLTEHVHIVSTLPQSGKVLPGPVENKGIMDKSEWIELLAESEFIIGFGDPVMGPSVYEAMSVGTAVIIPKFKIPVKIGDNKEVSLKSQHPYAEELGEPFCYARFYDDIDGIVEVLDKIHQSTGFSDEIVKDFRLEEYSTRLQSNLNDKSICGDS